MKHIITSIMTNVAPQSFQKVSIKGKRNAMLVSLVIAMTGAIMLFRSFAATTTEPTHGLMIQVSSLSPTISTNTLRAYLEDVRTKHRTLSPPDKNGNRTQGANYIDTLVLQDIADKDGNLYTNYLDIIAPYLPGGSTPAFDKVYVGTVDLSWTSSGSKYIEGIKDANFRSKNITTSTTAAKAFKARYPSTKIDWYITYEANAASFWDASIETAYLSYINQLTTSLNGVASGKQFMWSPAFWQKYSDMQSVYGGSLKQNYTDFFSKLTTPILFNFQDFVGQSKGASTKDDAIAWANFMKTNWGSKTKVSINTEQFTIDGSGAIIPGDSIELPARMSYYKSKGHALGPAWEIRYWHKRLYGN